MSSSSSSSSGIGNKYANCFLCDEIVYLYKRYSNKSSDNFFARYRAVVKENMIFCLVCYRNNIHRNVKR
ncbi:asb121 [Agrotis segetum nucleopolyhedrovirus B]|uniref:Asb121 n=1 Tax=Agrotis segetum nucleopolyhedrovirus B TaxID=1580580 RepID=A0A0A7KRD0_9ABAC|nr:asb121 [Agrotis segetum nucleopolyhedrovirus B]AIZ48678.1 asb121 [Agrotis segetum nucleopolyhedrovirus B]